MIHLISGNAFEKQTQTFVENGGPPTDACSIQVENEWRGSCACAWLTQSASLGVTEIAEQLHTRWVGDPWETWVQVPELRPTTMRYLWHTIDGVYTPELQHSLSD